MPSLRSLRFVPLLRGCGRGLGNIVSYETGSDGKDVGQVSLNVAIRIADALKVRDLRKLVAEDSQSLKENNAA